MPLLRRSSAGRWHALLMWILALLCAVAMAVPARSQEPKAKAGAKKAAAAAAAKKAPAAEGAADEAFPAESAPQPKAAAKKPAQAEVPQSESPAVHAVLSTNPTTPAECARAAKILFDLKSPALSKKFLQQALAANPDPQQLADMAQQFGSAMFLEMAAAKELLPEAKQLADAVLAAGKQHLQDPQRLVELIARLKDPSETVRLRALAGLQEARGAAVGPLIGVLADQGRADEHVMVQRALVGLGDDAVGPLLAILEQSDPKLTAQAIHVLGAIGASRVALYLLAPALAEKSDPLVRAAAAAALRRLVGHVPNDREAVRMLTERAKLYFDRRVPLGTVPIFMAGRHKNGTVPFAPPNDTEIGTGPPLEHEIDGHVELWRWDPAKKQCVANTYPSDDAFRVLAARLAHDALELAPAEQPVRLLYLATLLEQAAYENGLDKPLEDGPGSAVSQAAKFGMAAVEAALQFAISSGHPAAATAAAGILGRAGKADEILYHGPEPGPLVLATQNPDRRLRMAAAQAIVRLNPARPFAGSSYVPQTLGFFAGSSGTRRALVGGLHTEEGRELAGMMAAAGFDVDTASTGLELERTAAASPDYELALIDTTIAQPTIDLLLQQLRRDYRTADLRVGLIARAGRFEQAQQVAARYPLTLAFSRPHDELAFRWQIGQLSALAPREFVSQAERQRQAVAALGLLAELSVAPAKVYDLRRVQDAVLAALYTRGLGVKATAVLGNLGSPESQQALLEAASRTSQPLEVRQAAVEAFRLNTEKFGILLTAEEIRRQYDRYNQSESLDAPSRRVLSDVLDCIEAPTKTKGIRD